MKKYKIPIYWESYKTYEVEADNLQDAALKAAKQFMSEPDDNYLSDSFEIDDIVYDDYPDETINITKLKREVYD